jgi:hypothetical protein
LWIAKTLAKRSCAFQSISAEMEVVMKQLHIVVFAVLAVFVLALSGCESSTPTQSSEEAKPVKKEPSLYSGLQAFNTMNALALKWAPDATPVRLESRVNSESNGQGGKATVWRAGFISPSRHQLKFFLCSGSRLPDSPPYGVSSDIETPYEAAVGRMAFPAFLLKVDSDKAYDVAQQHGGASLLKKNPQQPVLYVLLFTPGKNALYWNVIYGTEEKSAGAGIVHATTGAWVSGR